MTSTTQLGWTFDPDRPVFTRQTTKPRRPASGTAVAAYLWARTVMCRSCTALIPLSPRWQLSSREGIRLHPNHDFKVVEFEIVPAADAYPATVGDGIATCVHCGTTTPRDYIASEAQAGRLGQVEYARLIKHRGLVHHRRGPPTKGRTSNSWYVPDSVLFESDRERWRCLASAGLITEAELAHDPMLRDLGLFGGEESEFAPGVERLG